MEEGITLFKIPGVPEYVVMSWIVMLILICLTFALKKAMSVVPGGLQTTMETIFYGIFGLMEDIMGQKGKEYFPLFATLALFILTSNLIGLLPGFSSPTNNLNTTVACALVVFFSTHYVGIRKHGIKYIKHFLGPVIFIAPLMMVIEIISHLSRPLSLSVRLFGNIMGEDILLAIILVIFPYFAPLPIMGLSIFTSFVQAFIFVLLSVIYIAGAIEEAH